MLFLVDANILITAERDYYPIAQIPEFWEWLWYQAEQGRIKIPVEIYDEILDGRKEEDPLLDWLKQDGAKEILCLQEESDVGLVQRVVIDGYAPDLTDDEIESLRRDPFLIAYALKSPDERCVVTNEVSKPSKTRQNQKVPDVCNTLGLTSIDPFELNRRLGFSTSWRPE